MSESIANDPHGVNGSVGYGYDPVGNRLNRTSSVTGVPSQSSIYDANDRLTNDQYDNNGNTIAATSNGYAYDFENHLTSLNNGAVTYVYDGDGNRVAKTVGGTTTDYLVDTNNPTGYAQVVDELQNGAVVRSFTYGQDLISQRIVGGRLSFYQYDGHGSVRQLTDTAATVTDVYDYDAFGNLIYRSGTTPNDYLYSGEQFDTNLGFYYLRARYMNPSSARFLTMDLFGGKSADPLSLHKYLYAEADPVNNIDPSGMFFSAVELSIANSMQSVLSNFQANLGFAVMNQIRYGGNAGLKDLAIGAGLIIGGAIALRLFGSLMREVPLLRSAGPSSVVGNALEAHEVELAEEIAAFRGGEFVGNPVPNFPGIDGHLDGLPVSLKSYSGSNPYAILQKTVDARDSAQIAGYQAVELFISAKGVRAQELLRFARNGPLVIIPNEGIISTINVLTQDGWIRIVGRY